MSAPEPIPEHRDVFGTVDLEPGASIGTHSTGDLWPTAWADDDALYTANGDGAGFGDGPYGDIVVSRIDGSPEQGLYGERLAAEREVSPVWGDPAQFNCKPTGIVAVDGNGDGHDELYLAVQDLPYGGGPDTFNQVPTASIVCSTDYGRTWQPTEQPMFTDHVFTTIMFADFGRSNRHTRVLGKENAAFVYAYGLDGNWRTSYSGAVPDPEHLYLARVPEHAVQDRQQWQFFAGRGTDGEPTWSADIAAKRPVLTDRRRLYPDPSRPDGTQTVIAQGGVVYNAPLRRYLYTSWTEYTFQFFIAEHPWGPWTLFHAHDFGPFPWVGPGGHHPHHGGYATTLPSKFISSDGLDLWLQSNWFVRSGAHTGNSYHFSLRRLRLRPLSTDGPRNEHDPEANLADASTGAVVVAANCRTGHCDVLNDGNHTVSEDSWNGQTGKIDFWGYTWPAAHRVDTMVLTTGPRDYVSGWFVDAPAVEIRRDGRWQSLPTAARIEPDYPGDHTATGHRRFTLSFPAVDVTGVRIVGVPYGTGGYSAIAELEVYYR